MKNIKFQILNTNEITTEIADLFVKLLNEQGKITAPNITRIKACKLIMTCEIENDIIGIGAIKSKTNSDFGERKANLPRLADEFEWELGYCYTKPQYQGKGISSFIVKNLLKEIGDINLIASTELFRANSMIQILNKNGFMSIGKPWKSTNHDGLLGLFIKAKKGINIPTRF